MKAQLSYIREAVRASLWFLPGLTALGALVLSYATVHLDHQLGSGWLDRFGLAWAGGADGAREILSTIAGSTITIAGVVFSITIVALTLASNQFGPRLLRNFTKEPANQWVLGAFIGTFLYSLLILPAVRSVGDQVFVPYLSVTVALFLAVLSLGALIYFIDHVAQSMQAEQLCASVGRELICNIDLLYPATGVPNRKMSLLCPKEGSTRSAQSRTDTCRLSTMNGCLKPRTKRKQS